MAINEDFLATKDSDTLIVGDDWDWEFTVNDKSGNPKDITSWEIWFTLKADPDDVDPGIFQHQQVITTVESTPASGIVNFNVPNLKTILADSEKNYYDIQLVNTTASPPVVKTIKYGRVKAVAHRTVSIA